MEKWTISEMNEMCLNVQKLSATDEEFRKQLLASPDAAIEKLTGRALPKNFTIKIVEQDPAYAATILLPNFIGDKLGDEDLESVAGGNRPAYEAPSLGSSETIEEQGIAIALGVVVMFGAGIVNAAVVANAVSVVNVVTR